MGGLRRASCRSPVDFGPLQLRRGLLPRRLFHSQAARRNSVRKITSRTLSFNPTIFQQRSDRPAAFRQCRRLHPKFRAEILHKLPMMVAEHDAHNQDTSRMTWDKQNRRRRRPSKKVVQPKPSPLRHPNLIRAASFGSTPVPRYFDQLVASRKCRKSSKLSAATIYVTK
jgi:hypothetical protein